MGKVWPWFAAALSGLLYAACFPPYDQNWCCWFALTPLVLAVWFSDDRRRRRWVRNLLLGYVSGILFFTVTFGWLGALGDLYRSFFLHGLSFLLSIYLAVHFAFWAWFVGLIKPSAFTASWRNLLVALFAAAAWASHEWIRGWLFSGFGWNGLGVGLHQIWPIIQISEITGVVGLSFAVAFANMIAATLPLRLLAEARNHRMRPHFDLTLTMIGIVALFAFGLHRAHVTSPTKPIRVAAIQGSIPQFQKFDARFTASIFETFQRLSEIGLSTRPPPDLLVWPESSMPDPVRDQQSESYRFVRDFSTATRTDLLLGSLDAEDGNDYNAAMLVTNGGERVQIYRKMHLVPFGEYIPLRHSFPLFAAIASTWVPGDFARGTQHAVFDLTNSDFRIAPLICFEDTVGDLVRHFVLNGANLLVDITNDAWFLQSAGSRQHLANAVFRCVENRRPLVRAANTGVTCFVDAFGRVAQVLHDDTGSTFGQGVLTGSIDVPQTSETTFYGRHGEWFAQCCCAITALTIASSFIRARLLDKRRER